MIKNTEDRIERIVGRPRPPMACGDFNVFKHVPGAWRNNNTLMCLCWMNLTNAWYFAEYYTKAYPQFKFYVYERTPGYSWQRNPRRT